MRRPERRSGRQPGSASPTRRDGPWSRRRLAGLALGVIAGVLALVVGAVWALADLLGTRPHHLGQDATRNTTGSAATTSPAGPLDGDPGVGAESELAAARPGTLSPAAAGTIELPAATSIGPAGVPTGFPRTPEGALAQLVAMDRMALESVSVPRTQEIVTHWAAPGGPTATSWTLTHGLARFLSAAGQPATGSTSVTLRADAAMGLIREDPPAADPGVPPGPSRILTPCVTFVLTATTPAGSDEIATADCQRLIWRTGRWMLAPGPEATPGPSIWPGTAASIEAGYQWLEVAP